MKILPVRGELLHSDKWTRHHEDKRRVHNSAKAPKLHYIIRTIRKGAVSKLRLQIFERLNQRFEAYKKIQRYDVLSSAIKLSFNVK